jgi:hypothetical protein
MDWFFRLTGFEEGAYGDTRRRLSIRDGRLYSDASEKSHSVGILQLHSLADLRQRRRAAHASAGLRLGLVSGDVRKMHALPDNAGAVFQVASQFNLLEMTGPSVTPEDGVTGYESDHTQGPACAIAAGAATIYRNYFAPVGEHEGQTADRQIDCLEQMGTALSGMTGRPVDQLWQMRNGYALPSREGLAAIDAALAALSPEETDVLRGILRVGAQYDVEVTDFPIVPGQVVSQVFCSALPIGYSHLPEAGWERFARLVLEATYEATLCCAEVNAARSGCNKVFLTLVGAGAFGNRREWVLAALKRALIQFRNSDLDVFVVSHGEAPQDLRKLAAEIAAQSQWEQMS